MPRALGSSREDARPPTAAAVMRAGMGPPTAVMPRKVQVATSGGGGATSSGRDTIGEGATIGDERRAWKLPAAATVLSRACQRTAHPLWGLCTSDSSDVACHASRGGNVVADKIALMATVPASGDGSPPGAVWPSPEAVGPRGSPSRPRDCEGGGYPRRTLPAWPTPTGGGSW